MFPTKNTFSPTAVMSPEEYNKTLMQCWKMLQAGRRVSIHRSLIQITGNDIKTAAFLSQLLYWLRVGTEVEQRDGWIFKSIQQTEYETGLTKTEQRKCKDDLKKLGFIQTGFFGQGRNLAFKINIDAICKAVCAQFGVQNMSQITLEDWRKQELDFFRIYFSDSVVYHMSLVQMTGDIYIAIMLSDILYNCAKNGSETSKLFKRQRLFSTATMLEWKNRTFITRTTQNRARKFLKHHGLIVEAHYLRNARIFTHPDGLLLMQLLKQRVRLPKLNQSVKPHAAAHSEMQQQSLLPQSVFSENCGNIDKSATPQVLNPASSGLANAESCNSQVLNPASSDLANAESCNSQVLNPASSDLANAESCNSQVLNPASSDLANAESCNSLIYKKPTVFSITTTTNSHEQSEHSENGHNGVVVVVDECLNQEHQARAFVAVGRFSGLVFPPNIHPEDKSSVLKIFNQHLSNADLETYQQILDETGAGGKNIKNPLSYIVGITKNAAKGEFEPTRAKQYRRQREITERNRANYENSLRPKFSEEENCLQTAEESRAALRERLKIGKVGTNQ